MSTFSTDRRVMCFRDRLLSHGNAVVDFGTEINLDDARAIVEKVQAECVSFLDWLRVMTEPSVTQPDIAFPRPHVCNSSRCCNRLEAR